MDARNYPAQQFGYLTGGAGYLPKDAYNTTQQNQLSSTDKLKSYTQGLGSLGTIFDTIGGFFNNES